MIFNCLFLTVGLVLLFFSSDWLVDNASSIAAAYSIKPIIIGLTIVAFGTSAPEFLVSLFASCSGESGISIGNILGSNVMNIALVLGLSIVIKPINIEVKGKINNELFFMVAVSIIFWVMCFDGEIGKFDGVFLISLLIVFLIYSYITSKKDAEDSGQSGEDDNLGKNLLFITLGIAGLCIGAKLVVDNAVIIANHFNISKTFIGLSVVAFGTSLPELATSVIAAKKGESDIAIGNVIGSNMFNICMVMGVVGLISPMYVEEGLSHFEFPFMVIISICLCIFLNVATNLNRKHGVFFLITFFIYITGSFYLTTH